MKKTNNMMKMFAAAIALSSAAFLTSCNKEDMRNQPVQNSSVDNGTEATIIAQWGFDSSFTEAKQHLQAVTHSGITFSSTEQAKIGKAALLSNKNGWVSYQNAGSALPNLTTGFSVDFFVYATPKEKGAQCVWCMPQSVDQNGLPSSWPTQHVLLDAYSKSQGDSALIKVMFKANKTVPYNEEWNVVSGIPKFYHHWSHIQYCYDGATSKFTLRVNGVAYFDHVVMYTDNPDAGGQPLGNIVANPDPQGVIFGAFQNNWKPGLFGGPQTWMLPFRGRIDAFKVYDSAIF